MRLHVFSDLHFDARGGGWTPKLAPEADAVLCAGDICEGLPEAFAFLRTFIPAPTPIITVAGNHSFYWRDHARELGRGRLAAREHRITFLENDEAIVNGVRFLGATFWTDYALGGVETISEATVEAYKGLNDHRLIRWGSAYPGSFFPCHAAEMHRASCNFLRDAFAQPFKGPTVVLTHHVPHPAGIAPQYHGSSLNPAFASDRTALIQDGRPDLWVFGHTHASCDFTVGQTRLICNPHGYGLENVSGFDPHCVVEVVAGQSARRLSANETV